MPVYFVSARLSKWLLALTAILAAGSLLGLILSYQAPEKLEQATSLLEYQHRGEFDYDVYLLPSYLYGPAQQNTLANQKIPAAIVDSIDFTFHYSPVNGAAAEMWIDAILENPGIWQKEVELVPPINVTADYTTNFSLDVSEINALFGTIEQEIGIASASHNVSISAFVGTLAEHSAYTLSLKLSATLVEIDNNLRIEQEGGTGEYDYVVNLKPNSIYDSDTITPVPSSVAPSITVLHPGDIIFPNLVDRIDVTYDYSFLSNKPIEPVATDLEIMVVLEASDTWAKEFPVLEATESGDFSVAFSLDIPYYLEMLKSIASETGVPTESHTLTVRSRLHASADTPFGRVDDTFSHQIVGTLKMGILQWEEGLVKVQNSTITVPQVVSNPQKIIGLSIPAARVTFFILTAVFFFLGIYMLILRARAGSWGLSWVEQEVLRIQKKYRDRIVEATGQTELKGERMISLDSIENLLSTADELGKLVIHQPPLSPGGRHAYYLFDGITRYQYLLDSGYIEDSFEVIKVEQDRSSGERLEP